MKSIDTTWPFKRIMVPLDGSYFSEQAISFAKAIAHAETNSLVLQIIPPGRTVHSLRGHIFVSGDEITRVGVVQSNSNLSLARQVWLSDRAHVRTVTTVGDAAVTIPTDVIVMTSHGCGGWRRMVLGSVAEKLVRQGLVPVLVVPAPVTEELSDYADELARVRVPEMALGMQT